MADLIASSQEAMERCASKSDNQAEAIDGVIGSIDTLVGEVLETWKGQSAEGFNQLWSTNLKGKFQQASQALRDLAKEVRAQSSQASEQDASNASHW